MSGKTTLVFKILENRNQIINKPIDNVQYIYGIDQKIFHSYSKRNPWIRFEDELSEEELNNRSLVVFDDKMSSFQGKENSFITNFVTRAVHHIGCSCIILLHNVFAPKLRTIALNTTYLIFFKQPRDNSTISILAKQMFPGQNSFLVEAYKFCTKDPHSYIFFDLSQIQNEKFRVRNNIFFTDQTYVIVPA